MTGNNRRGKSGNSKQKQKQKQKQEQNPNASKSSPISSSIPSSSVYDALSSTLTVNDEGIDGSVEESMENTETRQDLCEESLYEQSKDGDLRTATITSDIATEGLISEQNKDSGVEISSAEIVEQNVEASVSLLKSMDEIHVGGSISKDDDQFSNFDSQNINRDSSLLGNDSFLKTQHQNNQDFGDVSVDEDDIRRQTEEYYIRNANERAGSPKLFHSTVIISPEETNTLSEELTHTMTMSQEDNPSDSIVEVDDNVMDVHLKIHKMMQNNDDSLNLIGTDGLQDDASPKENMNNILEMGIGGYSPIAKESSLSQADELFPDANGSMKDFGDYSPCGPLLQSFGGIPKEKPQHPHSIALLRKAAKVPLYPVPQTTEDETVDMNAQDVQLPPEPHTPVTQKTNTASHHAPSSEDVTFPASSKQILRYHPGRAQTTVSHPGTLSWGEIVARFEIDHELDLTEYQVHLDLIGSIINLYDIAIKTQSVDAVRESIELIDITFKKNANDIKTQLAKQVDIQNHKMERLREEYEGLETVRVQLVDENRQLKAWNNRLQTRIQTQEQRIEDLRSQQEQLSSIQSIETEKPDIRKKSFPEKSPRSYEVELDAKDQEIRSLIGKIRLLESYAQCQKQSPKPDNEDVLDEVSKDVSHPTFNPAYNVESMSKPSLMNQTSDSSITPNFTPMKQSNQSRSTVSTPAIPFLTSPVGPPNVMYTSQPALVVNHQFVSPAEDRYLGELAQSDAYARSLLGTEVSEQSLASGSHEHNHDFESHDETIEEMQSKQKDLLDAVHNLKGLLSLLEELPEE